MSRGSSSAHMARSRKSVVFFWIALFVSSLALFATSAAAPPPALAAGPVIEEDTTINGCNGVVTTPGSENTNKRLIGGSLVPGGTATFEISFPVTAEDVGGDFEITDCVFLNDTASQKFFVHFVPNNEDFILTFTLHIPAGTPIGAEYCNYAKTTASPSASQASNRKAGPACFVVGGNISVLKKNVDGDLLAGAHFHIVCTLPTTQAFLPDTIIDGVSHDSTSGGTITQNVTTDSSGRIAIQAPEGTSCLITETQAPPGYDLADPDHKTLVATAAGVSYTFVDPVEFVPAPELSITKDATEQSYDSVGDVINYTIVAKNTGNVVLHNVTITDDNAALGTCTPTIPVTNLAINATITCTASHTITQADIDAGHYLNTACVNDGAGGAAQKCDDADVPSDKNPALSIVKDATEANYDEVGDVIHYSITAKNTGNTTLAAVTITDANATIGVCTPANGSPLAPGATLTCAAAHTITQADLDAGHYLNTACVNDGAGGAAEKCDDADVPGVKTPGLSITKDATEANYDAVGDIVHYSITAKNTGNTTLASVTITDANATLGTCTPANGSPLAPGATLTCAAAHTITQADIDAGHYLNTACVDDGQGGATQVCDDADVPSDKNPALSITKDAVELSYDAVGDVVHYSITAKNVGNTTLASVTITDANATIGVCTPANGSPLAPGATLTCTATHTITQADIDAGSYLNTACVDDGQGGAAEVCDDADVPSVKTPALSITKDANEANYDSVGDVITYSITAKNTGNTTLASVTITDANAILGTCTPANGSSLAPNATITCAASHTITQADLDAGHYLNTACVDDGQGGAVEVCDDANVPAVSNKLLTIVKTATEASYDSVGDIIHYTVVATNGGNTTLANVTITDANATLGTCTPANGSTLAPGGSITCTATHTVTQADIDAGHYLNTACVSATDATATCDDVDVPSDDNPDLSIEKRVTETSYDEVGDVLHYTIVAVNTGNVTLHNVVVTDPNVSGLVCGDGTNLAPGGSIICNATHTVTQADITAGHYLNTACVSATGIDSTCDSANVPAATLTIAKSNNAPIEELELPDGTTASLPTAEEGTTVTFTLTYSVGTTDVTNGVITDVLPVGLTYVDGSATNSAEFTFVAFNGTTRTLTWTAATVTTGGSVTYKAKVNAGASELEQPLTNFATIDSAETAPNTDTSEVFVPVIPEAETDVPSAPPTDTLEPTEGQSGSSLPLVLAVLGVILLAVAFVTPVPATVRRRNRR